MKDYALAVEVGKIVASTLLDKARLSTSLIENQTYYSLTDLQRVLPKQLGGYEARVIASSTDIMSMRQSREIIIRVQSDSELLSVRGFMCSAFVQPYVPA